jgi:adenine-specific DNA-methyltransferase
MCLITPSSCLKSKAGTNFRKYILKNKNLTKIVDLGHFQPFNATTYTMITLFEVGKKTDCIEYYTYDKINKKPRKVEILKYSDIFIGGNIFVSKNESLSLLHQISNYNFNIFGQISVKNGFATLADSVFIDNFEFDKFTIKTLKASTGKWSKCVFPYNKFGQPIAISEIKEKNPLIYKHLIKNKDVLERRCLESKSQWYLFGRTQAIKDVYKNKIAVNTIIKDINSIRLELVPAGCGVYSGLYILSDYSIQEIEEVLKSNEFIEYLKLLKNYKSGGYFTLSSSELQKFLTYKLRKNNYEQQSIFKNNRQLVY